MISAAWTFIIFIPKTLRRKIKPSALIHKDVLMPDLVLFAAEIYRKRP